MAVNLYTDLHFQVALAHKKQVLSQAIRDSSIYHFLIWPPPLAEVAENELCSEIQRRNVSRFLVLNSNVFILYADTERRIHLYEVYAVQSSLICQPVINSIEFFEIANKVVRRVDFKGSVLTGTAAIVGHSHSSSYNIKPKLTVIPLILMCILFYFSLVSKISQHWRSDTRRWTGRLCPRVDLRCGYLRTWCPHSILGQELISKLCYMLGYHKLERGTFLFRDNYTIGGWVNLNRSSGLVYGVSVDQMNSGMADLFLTQTTLSPFRARGFNYLQPTFHDSWVTYYVNSQN